MRSLPISLVLALLLDSSAQARLPAGQLPGSHRDASRFARKEGSPLARAGKPARRRSAPAEPRLLDPSEQLVLVTAKSWSSADGELRRYRRSRAGGPWRAVGERVRVALGRNGLAWGKGLHGAAPGQPVKTEGDGCAPAGAFRLSGVFGYAPSLPSVKLPYLAVAPSTECVDDPASGRYNTILDKSQIKRPDWRSSERMLRPDGLYRVGILVDHNADPVVASAGSCIFIHIWSGPGQGTAGCTSMPAARVEELAGWLDPSAKPALVQLPESEYRRVRSSWGLP